jgi:hypothetical protein
MNASVKAKPLPKARACCAFSSSTGESGMRDFVAIDFETANPQRVSACALGFARVVDGQVVETLGHLIKPVGGHAAFQTRIHGICAEHTNDKPDFGEIFPEIRHLLNLKGKRIKWLILPLHESETDRHLIGLSG